MIIEFPKTKIFLTIGLPGCPVLASQWHTIIDKKRTKRIAMMMIRNIEGKLLPPIFFTTTTINLTLDVRFGYKMTPWVFCSRTLLTFGIFEEL